MTESAATTGSFVLSLDTELSWGCFDTSGIEVYEGAYRETPRIIDNMCDLFDEYDIPATWAMVMHLLDDCANHNDLVSPDYDWVDWFEAVPCATSIDKELWYAPGLLERIRSTDIPHEIGLHGYSHMILGASGCTRDAASAEIKKTLEVAEKNGINAKTYVFPRNNVGHCDILREMGVQYYRGTDARWYEEMLPESLKKPFRFADEYFKRSPPVVDPQYVDGLVEIPGSQILRPFGGPWKHTPKDSQYIRAKKGVDRAEQTGKVYHLWFHPFNLAIEPERHLRLLEQIISYAAKRRDEGNLKIETMADVASRYERAYE